MNIRKKMSCLLGLVLLSGGVQAENNEAVELKCHVELFGGLEVIYFVKAKENGGQALVNKLVGKNVTVAGSRKKKKIYQVKECADLHDKFIGAQANKLDADTVR